MPDPIDFYFDFSSPYAYFGSARLETIAKRHGRTVRWRPILLGAVFKISGGAPVTVNPMRWAYAKRDMYRTARLHNIAFALPTKFPFAAANPSRVFYWLQEHAPAQARDFAEAVFVASFSQDRDVTDVVQLDQIALSVGATSEQVRAALTDEATKDKLRHETDAAIARGVFGAPFMIVDDEPFWGNDRLVELDEWLVTGGW